MKVPLSWLKEFVNLDGFSVEEIAKQITLAGSEISSIETTGGDIPGVIIGKIVSKKISISSIPFYTNILSQSLFLCNT